MTPQGRLRATVMIAGGLVLFLIAGLFLGQFEPRAPRASTGDDLPAELAGAPSDWRRRADQLESASKRPGTDVVDARAQRATADRLRRHFDAVAADALAGARRAVDGRSDEEAREALRALGALGANLPDSVASEVDRLRAQLEARLSPRR